MLELYSHQRQKKWRVAMAFIGGEIMPTYLQCCAILTMDPDIDTTIMVVPFTGLVDDGSEDDDSIARRIIRRASPMFAENGFPYKQNRIQGLLLIKVLVPRDFPQY